MTQKTLFKPLKSKRTFEEISEQIKGLIYARVLKPGDKLPPEREIGRQFNTGRMVVREALRILEQSGLITIRRGNEGGAFIRDMDATVVTRSISDVIRLGNVTLDNLTEVRLGTEMFALDLAAKRITDNDLALLRDNIESTQQIYSKKQRIAESNKNFHILIARAAKNPLLEMIMESVMDVVLSFLGEMKPDLEFLERHINFHEKIYESMRDRDFHTAKIRLKRHIVDTGKKFSELTGKKSLEKGL